MVFSPDCKSLVTWAFGAVITWEVSSGRELQKLRGSKLYASNTALSPTGKLPAAAYSDGLNYWKIHGTDTAWIASAFGA
jgi:hypothetical protein